MDFSIVAKPEMVEGLEVGYGLATEETTGTAIDDSALYVKYTYGSVTVGYQINELMDQDRMYYHIAGIGTQLMTSLLVTVLLSQTKLQTLMCKKQLRSVLHTLQVVLL